MNSIHLCSITCRLKEESGIINLAYGIANKLGLTITPYRISVSNYLFSVDVKIVFLVSSENNYNENSISIFENLIQSKSINNA